MDKDTKVHRYGLHVQEDVDVTWLLQDSGAQNAVGLSKSSCPFKIFNKRLGCPHGFDIKSNKKLNSDFEKLIAPLMNHEVFKFVSPVPYKEKYKTIYIHSSRLTDISAINYLQLMSNPITNCHAPMKTAVNNMGKIKKIIEASNLSRYCISGFTADDCLKLNKVSHAAIGAEGRLILVGERFPAFGFDGVIKFMPMEKEFGDAIIEIARNFESDQFRRLGNIMMKDHLLGKETKLCQQ